MALEAGTYISDLVATNPTASDPKSEGDDHLRLLKSTVKATFPNLTGAVTPTQAELNHSAGVTSAIQPQIDGKSPIAGPGEGQPFATGPLTLGSPTVNGKQVLNGPDSINNHPSVQIRVAGSQVGIFSTLGLISGNTDKDVALFAEIGLDLHMCPNGSASPRASFTANGMTLVGEVNIGAVNVNETELGILDGATLTTAELNYSGGVTSAIQTQIDTKAAQTSISNIDNTSDANKPVSTAQQTALNLKANLASPTLTGVPAAPTAAPGTNTTQLATTAFVSDANAFSGCLIRDTGLSLSTGVYTILSTTLETYDTDLFHSTSLNPSRLTVPSGVTYVRLTATARFAANATGYRQVRITKNGASGTFADNSELGQTTTPETVLTNISHVIPVVAGDYFELSLFQDSGGALSVAVAEFSIEALD